MAHLLTQNIFSYNKDIVDVSLNSWDGKIIPLGPKCIKALL